METLRTDTRLESFQGEGYVKFAKEYYDRISQIVLKFQSIFRTPVRVIIRDWKNNLNWLIDHLFLIYTFWIQR